LTSISSTADSPISAPPIAAEIGVKLAIACLVANVDAGRDVFVAIAR
jgi:hypothetical protein